MEIFLRFRNVGNSTAFLLNAGVFYEVARTRADFMREMGKLTDFEIRGCF